MRVIYMYSVLSVECGCEEDFNQRFQRNFYIYLFANISQQLIGFTSVVVFILLLYEFVWECNGSSCVTVFTDCLVR